MPLWLCGEAEEGSSGRDRQGTTVFFPGLQRLWIAGVLQNGEKEGAVPAVLRFFPPELRCLSMGLGQAHLGRWGRVREGSKWRQCAASFL